MRYPTLILRFLRLSFAEETAYRSNFTISVLHAVLNLATGVLGLFVLFGQVEQVQGWDFPATLALLGVYLTLGGLRSLFMGPSLDSLAGMEGDVWTGRLDFTLLRPVNVQFLASFRRWRLLSLLDVALGLGVVGGAAWLQRAGLSPGHLLEFLLMLTTGLLLLYSLLLALTALIFWVPGFLFTWLFDSFFQMARYPLGLYPGWIRLLLTWIVPVGVITTVPAEALAGRLTLPALVSTLVLTGVAFGGASALFQRGLRRYESASS